MKFRDKRTGNILETADELTVEQYKKYADRYEPVGGASAPVMGNMQDGKTPETTSKTPAKAKKNE
jgi:hypothetical protein